MHGMKVSLLLGAAMFVIAGAQTSFAATAALTGKVTSAKEGAMFPPLSSKRRLPAWAQAYQNQYSEICSLYQRRK